MQQIVLATGNAGKVAEFATLLADSPFQIVPQSDFNVTDAIEDGTTFVENAIIKARHAARITGLAAIADDSGIEVDALQGQPGIHSARYGGEHGNAQANIDLLLRNMAGIESRTARFQCVLVYLRHADDPSPIIAQASWEGRIAQQASGAGGHGYDPIFLVGTEQRSAAELSEQEKNAISHRGKALQLLLAGLQEKGIL